MTTVVPTWIVIGAESRVMTTLTGSGRGDADGDADSDGDGDGVGAGAGADALVAGGGDGWTTVPPPASPMGVAGATG
jgi:hypothetical protein